jgi:PadR family transcriptional regulator PadR
MDRELKRGTLEMIILSLLDERPMYGFEIITEMRDRSAAKFEMKEGTLYPVLYRMEEGQRVSSRWVAEGRAAPRKYYHITERGREDLKAMLLEWATFSQSIDQILGANTGRTSGGSQ